MRLVGQLARRSKFRNLVAIPSYCSAAPQNVCYHSDVCAEWTGKVRARLQVIAVSTSSIDQN